MIITNSFNLPQVFVNAAQRPTYTKAGAKISVSELITSPRIVQLKARYPERVEDASDHVYALLGGAVHAILEKHHAPNQIVEERLHAIVNDWHISGAMDSQEYMPDIGNVEHIEIGDFKVTNVFAVTGEEPKREWVEQLNIYAWLVEVNKGIPVKKLKIWAILKDWSKTQVKEGYPAASIVEVPIPLWSFMDRQNFIAERIAKHQLAEVSLPLCTDEDMWVRPTTWAIIKTGGMRASKVFGAEDDALEYLAEKGAEYELVKRPGQRLRCEMYCSVSQHCDQYQLYLKEEKGAYG